MKKLLPLLFLFLATPLLAQEQLSTTAIPPRLEVEALPGAIVQETLKVRNETDADQAYEVKIMDFIVNDNQGTPVPVNEAVSGRWSLAAWMTVSPKQIMVPAGQTATVDLIVSVPPNGLPGGHYAMVAYSPIAEGIIPGTGTAINPQVGSLIYLKVIGDITEAVNLKQFQVDAKFKSYGPTQINAEIENLGDIHLQPIGKLTVTNWLNDEVYSADLEAVNIFPFASRAYEWTMPGKWHLGRYAAKLTAQAGETAIPINGLIYFWIVPVKELAMAAAIILLIIIVIILKKRRQPPIEIPTEVPSEQPSLS